MKASDLFVTCLEREGVERVFGLPGEELEDVLFSIRDSDVEFVPVRHEQGAAFMADVHGRVTGEAGVCLATLGPGATNLLTGVADAHLGKAPLVAITGQGSLERLHKESHQKIDVVDTFEQVVKWNAQVSDPETVPEQVRKAFKVAEFEKPGATHLELPEDVAAETVDAEPLATRSRVRRASPDRRALERAAELLDHADRPMVLAGNGAVRTRAAEALQSLVTHAGLPVVATYSGKGAVSDRLDNSLLTLDSGPDDESASAIEEADCVLAVGYDVAEHDPASWNADLDTDVVHVDHEPAETYRHYNPVVEVISDVSAALRALREELSSTDTPTWCGDLRERVIADVREEPDPDEGFSVSGTLPYLRDAMADDDVLISDVGSHKMTIAREFPVYQPGTCVISNGLASMGIAVPGAVAADLAVDANVVVGTGDGGFLMNAAELDTATRLDCGFTVLLFVDDEYRLISEEQLAHRGETFGTELTNPDFQSLADSFGIAGHRPEGWADLERVLEETVPSDEMALVEVPLGS